MEKKQYKAPEFRFQELFLFEGVADTCWGFHKAEVHIFYDTDHDDVYDEGEPRLFDHTFTPSEGGHGNGCDNVTVAMENALESIHQAFIDAGYGRYWTPEVIATIRSKENVGSSSTVYIPVHS